MVFQDLGQILVNSASWVDAMKELIPSIAKVTGYIFAFQGYLKLQKLGDQRQDNVTVGSVITTFLISAALVQYGNTQAIATDALGLSGGVSYVPETNSAYMDSVVRAVLSAVELFGTWAIFSSLLDAKKAGDGDRGGGQDIVSRAMWKFVGGALALNIKALLG